MSSVASSVAVAASSVALVMPVAMPAAAAVAAENIGAQAAAVLAVYKLGASMVGVSAWVGGDLNTWYCTDLNGAGARRRATLREKRRQLKSEKQERKVKLPGLNGKKAKYKSQILPDVLRAGVRQASVRPIGDAINLMYIGLFFLGAGT
jgi:hypothetical protein